MKKGQCEFHLGINRTNGIELLKFAINHPPLARCIISSHTSQYRLDTAQLKDV